uniref:Uncharacterized protein n=1 Tax=Tanacetum cinerariifolium TaxID=118510 RepID=A0A699HLV7_TANCI|nr:hypothetical protein [Tanacetum cinerariifolium]
MEKGYLYLKDLSRRLWLAVVMHDDSKYKGMSLYGYIDAGGSSTCCDLVHEITVYDGPSLPHMDKKNGSSKVNVTRKRSFLNRLKILRSRKFLRKTVAGGTNYKRLGSLIGLNEDEGYDDPQQTTQVSLTLGSFNNDVKDVD